MQMTGSKLEKSHPHEHLYGEDKFHILHPDTNWQFGLEHAERIGIGTRQYEFVTALAIPSPLLTTNNKLQLSLFSFSFLPPLLPSLFSSHYYHNGSKPRDSVPLRRLCFVIPLATAHVSGIAHSSPCHNGSISHNSVTLWQT